MNGFLCDTPITSQQVLSHLQSYFGPKAILESFEANKVNVGEGVVSHILRLKLKWAVPDGLPESIIVKVPTLGHTEGFSSREGVSDGQIGMMMDVMAVWVPFAHNVECRVYDMFGEKPPIPVPRCFAAVQIKDGTQGMLVMEDLSSTAATSPSFQNGMTYQQVCAAVDAVARLHAWALTTTTDWRSNTPSFEEMDGIMRSHIEPAATVVAEMKALHPDVLGPIDMDKVKELMQYDNVFGIWTEYRSVMDDCFVHADYHKNNILFEKNPDGTVSDRLTAIIDFQCVIKGPPTYDLARLLAFSVTQAFRDKHETELLRRYYDSIKSLADEKFKPSFEQMCRWYYRQLTVEAIQLVVWIPAYLSIAVKSEGEQKKKDERKFLEGVLECYSHAMRHYEES